LAGAAAMPATCVPCPVSDTSGADVRRVSVL